MNNLLKYFARQTPTPVALDMEELVKTVGFLLDRLNKLAVSFLIVETILEHHNLWTPEVQAAVKPLLDKKLMPQPVPETEPEQSPSDQ